LVIVTFLNAYDWVKLMRQHAPAHVDLYWPDFITSPWVHKRSNVDFASKPKDTTVMPISNIDIGHTTLDAPRLGRR
jgi:hypothetical protein